MRSIVVLTALLTCTIAVRAQNTEPRIWQGVYTAAQAERGKASFNSSCLRCHGDRAAGQYGAGTVRRPVLHVVGQRGDCVAVREDSRHDAAELRHQHRRPDQARHRAYILQTNGYPAGPSELAQTGRISPARRSSRRVSSRSCRTSRSCRRSAVSRAVRTTTWILTRTADPLVTRDDVPSAQSLVGRRDASARDAHVPAVECDAVQPRVTSGPQDGSARLDLQRARRRAAHADVAADGRELH